MASLIRHNNGRVRILFVDGDGARRTIRFGRLDQRAAEAVKHYVERLAEARRSNTLPPVHVAAWRDALPDREYARLVRAGLADPRDAERGVVLNELLGQWAGSIVVKPATMAAYKQAVDSLRAFFGPGFPVAKLTTQDADRWRRHIAEIGIAPATQAKRVHIARAIFNRARRWKLIDSNPFEHVKAGPQVNAERMHYVPRGTIRRVIDSTPDPHWKAVFALARFAALRCPSEILELSWEHVDWSRRSLLVRSPKTSGTGHAVRTVPIDPELHDILLALFDAAAEGEPLIVPTLRDVKTNLRTHAERIIIRAGIVPWPKVFQNLRSSCETDWSRRHPIRDVAAWTGHGPGVALRHYLQPSESSFAAVTGQDLSGVGALPKSGAESGALGARKAARTALATNSHESAESSQVLSGASAGQSEATHRNFQTRTLLGAAGFEPA